MRRRESGFSAAEILVVLTIVGILAAVAIPSMSNMLIGQSVRSAAYDLHADLIYARGEAIARGANVSLIANSGTDMKTGWAIRDAAGATLRSQGSRTSAVVFTASGNTVTFDKTGRVSAGAPASWGIRPSDTSAQDYQKRCIRLDPSGKPRSEEGNSCGY